MNLKQAIVCLIAPLFFEAFGVAFAQDTNGKRAFIIHGDPRRCPWSE